MAQRVHTFPAHRYSRGGIAVFVVAVPLQAIAELLPEPDPAHKFPGNRRVDLAHAEGFSLYWQHNERWATPPLLLDTEARLGDRFQQETSVLAVSSGMLTFPDDSKTSLEILDGQHRILGWHIAAEQISAGLRTSRRALENAHLLGDTGAGRSAGSALDRWTRLSERLQTECVTLEIFEGVGIEEHKQLFSDIATNAKGITKSQVAAFDQRDLVNRVAAELAVKHPLVDGIVDFEKDRMAGASENLLSAKTLVDVVRAASIGFESRATQKREALLAPEGVRDVTLRFLDVLLDEVPGLARVASGAESAAALRARSLIASATILRCLAGAFRIVAVDGIDELRPRVDDAGELAFRRMLHQLAGSWSFPIDGRWFATGYFPHTGSRAPSSRAQDLKGMTMTLASWARAGVPAARDR
ncbi:DNA sulfur modification protein DndB [Cellulomonas hominis]|uniref:DNA sulfur modification protein DndB n=1 Tax=Cellulomonas hominis TaxID=156981 RepID=UPI0024BEB1DC|nr:DNA sulfur modification protein DndB [Cellulomonas hominis]